MPSKVQLQALRFAQLGCEEALLQLIEQQPELLNCYDKDENTVLLLALKHHHLSLAEKLFIQNAKLNVANKKGMTPLHYAIKREYFDLARSMLVKPNGVSINAKNNKGESALMLLARKGDLETAYCMMSKYPDVGLRNADGKTVLAIALLCHQFQLADFIIHSHAEINTKDNDGNTPLHIAVMSDDNEAIEYLLAHQASFKIPNKENNTVLDIVAGEGDVVLIESFRAQDPADPQAHLSLFQWACSKGYVDILKNLLASEPINMASAPVAQIVQDPVQYNYNQQEETIVHAVSEIIPLSDMEVAKHEAMEQSQQSTIFQNSIPLISAPVMQVQSYETMIEKKNREGETPLLLAITNNKIKVVQFLIENHVNVNTPNALMQTPLILAIENYYTDIVRLLIKSGANLEAVNMHGLTAMRIAFNLEAKTCALEFYKHIRALGHSIESAEMNEAETRTLSNITKENYVENALIVAVKEDNLAEAKRLIQQCGANVNDVDREGKSALYHATSIGSYPLAELLIRGGADVNTKTPQNDTSLMVAARKGQADITKLLIDNDVDLLQVHQDKSTALEMAYNHSKMAVAEMNAKAIVWLGWSLPRLKKNMQFVRDGVPLEQTYPIGLIEAAKTNDLDLARRLVQKGAKVDARNVYGETAMQVVCNHGHIKMMKYLHEQEANINTTNKEGLGLIHSAAVYNQVESLIYLFDQKLDLTGKTSTLATYKSMTPLHFASKHGSEKALEYLLSQDTVEIHEKNYDESTSLHLAATHGNRDCCFMLLTKGASLLSKDKQKRLPLEVALIDKQQEAATFLYDSMIHLGFEIPTPTPNRAKQLLRYIEEHSATENLLIKYVKENRYEDVAQLLDGGANIAFRDESKQTPLFYALQNRNHELTLLLLSRGADLEEVNEEGYTYVMSAARGGDLASIQYFVSLGANVMTKSKTGSIALFHAIVHSDEPQVISYLLTQAPHSVSHQDNEGWSALFFAESKNQQELVKYLLSLGADPKVRTQSGHTMLMHAAFCGNIEMLKSRLVAGDNVEEENYQARTALHLAAEASQLEACKLLLIAMKNKKLATPKYLKNLSQISKIEKDIQEYRTYCLFHYRKKAPLDEILKYSQVEFQTSVLDADDKTFIFNQVKEHLDKLFSVNASVVSHLDSELTHLGIESKTTLNVLIELDGIMMNLEASSGQISPELIELELLKEGKNKSSGLNLALKSGSSLGFFSGSNGRRRSESLGKIVSKASDSALRESIAPIVITGTSNTDMLGSAVDSDENQKSHLLNKLQLNFSQPSQRDFWASKVRGGGGVEYQGAKIPNTIFKLQGIITSNGSMPYVELLFKLKSALQEEKTIQDNRMFSTNVTRSKAVSQLIRECDNLGNIDFSSEASRLRVSSF